MSPKFEERVPEKRNHIVGTEYDEGRMALEKLAAANLKSPPVTLSLQQVSILQIQLEETALYRQFGFLAGAIMGSHVDLLVGVHGNPPPESLLRDFKS